MKTVFSTLFVGVFSLSAAVALAQDDAQRKAVLDNALQQKPVQTDVEIDIPTPEEAG